MLPLASCTARKTEWLSWKTANRCNSLLGGFLVANPPYSLLFSQQTGWFLGSVYQVVLFPFTAPPSGSPPSFPWRYSHLWQCSHSAATVLLIIPPTGQLFLPQGLGTCYVLSLCTLPSHVHIDAPLLHPDPYFDVAIYQRGLPHHPVSLSPVLTLSPVVLSSWLSLICSSIIYLPH